MHLRKLLPCLSTEYALLIDEFPFERLRYAV